jgi:RNA polymerase sigma-70 factor (ECF subfamily)
MAAEDIAQDALLALVRRWRTIGPPESPDAFVFAIAKRRATRVNLRRLLFARVDRLDSLESPTRPADVVYEKRVEALRIFRVLRRMSRSDREVLLLSAVGELDTGSLASVLRTTPAAVKMRLHRSRQRLRRLLAEDTNEQDTTFGT